MRRWNVLGVVLSFLLALVGFQPNGLAAERYTVKPGDTLFGISKSFGVSIEKIKEVNHLRKEILKPKQVLVIPTAGTVEATAVREDTWIVRKGDTLSSISKRSGVSVGEIKAMNQLRSAALKPGQQLILQRPKVETEEELEESGDLEETAELLRQRSRKRRFKSPLRNGAVRRNETFLSGW